MPTPSIHNHNNILQVLCVGKDDNYLDMLTEKWGDYDRALKFVQNCALTDVRGDCQLIQQIYFDQDCHRDHPSPIGYTEDNQLCFIDENERRIVDHKGNILGRRLANNLQISYLKGVNYLINKNITERRSPNRFLDEYDLQTWNRHTYNLLDPNVHQKIMKNLDIPPEKIECDFHGNVCTTQT